MPKEYRLILKHADEPRYSNDLGCYLKHGGYKALKKGNVQTPRDLAAWRGAGDVLRDMLIEEGVAADACPGAAALGAWADAASRALTEDPALGAHVSGFRGGE